LSPIGPFKTEQAAMRFIMPTPNIKNANERTIAPPPRSLLSDVPPGVLRAAFLTAGDVMRRFSSSRDAALVVGRTFAGAVVGGLLGAVMFSSFDVPYSWAGLIFGAALGSAFAMGEQPRR
jgi:hypothetical protein